MPVIASVATTVPPHSAAQPEARAAFAPLFALAVGRREAALALYDRTEIERRYSVLSLDEIGLSRSLAETMRLYAVHARVLAERVARDCLQRAGQSPEQLDLLISVSCTGVMIPSVDAYLMDALGTRRDLTRLPITELGCSGGAASVARAYDYLRGYPARRALVVSVELPSLNLQRHDKSVDNLVASALFGDGAAAVLVVGDETPEAEAAMVAGSGTAGAAVGLSGELRPVRIRETLAHTRPASTGALGFDLRDDGFHAVLARDVPDHVRADLGGLVARLAARGGLDPATLDAFVLHPGGRKILGAAEEALGLPRDRTQPSWDVLRDYGNQSSASVLFVLEKWMTDRQPPRGTHGVMGAFGPGLTTELLLLEWL